VEAIAWRLPPDHSGHVTVVCQIVFKKQMDGSKAAISISPMEEMRQRFVMVGTLLKVVCIKDATEVKAGEEDPRANRANRGNYSLFDLHKVLKWR
jgi:hypothetical protein